MKTSNKRIYIQLGISWHAYHINEKHAIVNYGYLFVQEINLRSTCTYKINVNAALKLYKFLCRGLGKNAQNAYSTYHRKYLLQILSFALADARTFTVRHAVFGLPQQVDGNEFLNHIFVRANT